MVGWSQNSLEDTSHSSTATPAYINARSNNCKTLHAAQQFKQATEILLKRASNSGLANQLLKTSDYNSEKLWNNLKFEFLQSAMARRLVCSISSTMGTLLLVLSSVGLILVTTFTDAAAILPENQTPVKLYSKLTGQHVVVSADGTIRANGASENSMYCKHDCVIIARMLRT